MIGRHQMRVSKPLRSLRVVAQYRRASADIGHRYRSAKLHVRIPFLQAPEDRHHLFTEALHRGGVLFGFISPDHTRGIRERSRSSPATFFSYFPFRPLPRTFTCPQPPT